MFKKRNKCFLFSYKQNIIIGMEQIEINRKVFDVIEQLGSYSYKGTRKGKEYFIKCFPENRKKEFDEYVDCGSKLKNNGISAAKIYTYDKRKYMVAVDYVDGVNPLKILEERDLNEDEYNLLFNALWRARTGHIALDFKCDNFRIADGKLFYLPFLYNKHDIKDSFDIKEDFLHNGIKYWIYSKELMIYLASKNMKVDESRLKNEFETNRAIALIVCKFFR